MKKDYQHPWLRIVEVDENDIVCTSPQPYNLEPEIEVGDYNTFDVSNTGFQSDF